MGRLRVVGGSQPSPPHVSAASLAAADRRPNEEKKKALTRRRIPPSHTQTGHDDDAAAARGDEPPREHPIIIRRLGAGQAVFLDVAGAAEPRRADADHPAAWGPPGHGRGRLHDGHESRGRRLVPAPVSVLQQFHAHALAPDAAQLASGYHVPPRARGRLRARWQLRPGTSGPVGDVRVCAHVHACMHAWPACCPLCLCVGLDVPIGLAAPKSSDCLGPRRTFRPNKTNPPTDDPP